MKTALLALAAVATLSNSAFAAGEQVITCKNESNFQVTLTVPADTQLGTLVYGQPGALTTVEGVETSLIQGLGAAVKGNDVLFVISPEGDKKVGELIVEGKTFRVTCN